MLKAIERILWGVAVITAVLIGLFLWREQTATGQGALAFDPGRWQADTVGCSFYRSSVRQRMASDLAVQLTRPPAMRDQVRIWLGAPDFEYGDAHWSYYAGASTMDCVSFDVRFAPDGSVSRAGLVQH